MSSQALRNLGVGLRREVLAGVEIQVYLILGHGWSQDLVGRV